MSEPTKPSAEGTTEVPLKHPVTVDGLRIDHLTVRRPKVRDQLHATRQGGTDAEQEVSQFASLAGVSPAVIGELDLSDYVALQKVYQGFLS